MLVTSACSVIAPPGTEPPSTLKTSRAASMGPVFATVIETCAGADICEPSEAMYVKLSDPLKPACGTYENEPFPVNDKLPCAGSWTSWAVRTAPG